MHKRIWRRKPAHGTPAVFLSTFLMLFLLLSRPAIATVSAYPEALQPYPRGHVSAGLLHSLVVHLDGRVYAMGDNQFGQLGIPEEHDYAEPVAVNLPEKAIAASAGAYHSLVLSAGGRVYSFGRNAYGQLGTGTTDPVSEPRILVSLPRVTAIAAGAYHSLVLTKVGSVFAFGDNTYGQCGPALSEPILNEKGEPVSRRVIRPQKIIDSKAVAIAAGTSHSLVLLEDGQVLAFGDNSRGQLGSGATDSSNEMIAVAGITNAMKIAAGGDHSLVVTDAGQTLLAFGDNSLGQAGTGSDFGPHAMVVLPTAVDWMNGTGQGQYAIADVYAGYGNSALVVTSRDQSAEDPRDTKILIWGSNAYGQLGAGSGPSRDKPVALAATDQGRRGDQYLPIDSLAIGNGQVLIFSSRGLLGSAGRNDNGQTGQPAGQNPAQFFPLGLPLLVEPLKVQGQDHPTTDAAEFKASLWGSRLDDDGYSLALQVPWDTTGLPGHGTVRPPFDWRTPVFAGSAILILVVAGLFIRLVHNRRHKKSAAPSP